MDVKCEKNLINFSYLIIILLLLFVASSVNADTHISGGSVFNQYWTQSEGPYIIEGTIAVPVETLRTAMAMDNGI